MAETPLAPQTIKTHFDSDFLSQVSPDRLNTALSQFQLTQSASLVGLLSKTDTTLVAIVAFGLMQVKVTMAVDGSGLIDGLLLQPATVPTTWASVDHALFQLGPDVGFLAAQVLPSGTCQPVHTVASSIPRPLASQFKLFVLGALANQIAAGRLAWGQTLTVQDATKSLGNPAGSGSLQYSPAGTTVSVEEAAMKMISISDNTAADMLIGLVGRKQVEAQVQRWSAQVSSDEPFLTTREMFLLHYVDFPALANRYLSTPQPQREAFLAASVDTLPLRDIQASSEPRDVEKIEWFASPDDICRAFASLKRLLRNRQLTPLSTILSHNAGGIALDPTEWHTVWFKGGSEPGVVTLGYVATNSRGKTFLVAAMVSNPNAALPPVSAADLVNVAKGAFGLLG